MNDDKKKVREDALLIASEYQGTFLKSGREISVPEAEQKIVMQFVNCYVTKLNAINQIATNQA